MGMSEKGYFGVLNVGHWGLLHTKLREFLTEFILLLRRDKAKHLKNKLHEQGLRDAIQWIYQLKGRHLLRLP